MAKTQILKNLVAVVTSMLTYISRRLQNVPRQLLGKVAKFGGHSLNGCEVIQLFSEGRLQKPPPGLKRINIRTKVMVTKLTLGFVFPNSS